MPAAPRTPFFRSIRVWLAGVAVSVVVALGVVGGGGVWLADRLQGDLAEVDDRMIPALHTSHALVQDAQALGQLVLRIGSATTQAERLTVSDLITDRTDSLRGLIDRLKADGFDRERLLETETVLAELIGLSNGIAALREAEIDAEARLQAAAIQLANQVEELSQQGRLDCLVGDGDLVRALVLTSTTVGPRRVQPLIDRLWVRGARCGESEGMREVGPAALAAGPDGVLTLRLLLDDLEGRRTIAGFQIQQAVRRFAIVAASYDEAVESTLARRRAAAAEEASRAVAVSAVVIGGLWIGVILLFALFDRRVIGRVVRLRAALDARRDGDRSSLLIEGRDEIAEMAQALDRLIGTIERQAEELRWLATTDALTGVLNRRAFRAACERELRRAARHDLPMAIAILDLDRFKQVNDQHGHAVGDAVLLAATRRWQAALRSEDLLGRLGGEEFAVLLPMTAEPAARLVCDRLCAALRAEPVPTNGAEGAVTVTTSIGLTVRGPGDSDIDALFLRADRALYAAKDAGRDRVEVADERSAA